MALIIALQNITEGGIDPGDNDRPISEYRYTVLINERPIEVGVVTGHARNDGWRKLVQKVIDKA